MFFNIKVLIFVAVVGSVYSCLRNAGNNAWKPAQSNSVPAGSVLAGLEIANSGRRSNTYLSRAGDKFAKYNQGTGACYLNANGKENIVNADQCQMLVDVGHTVWVPVANKTMPCNVIQTGATFAGRANHGKQLLPGYISNGVIYVTYIGPFNYNVFEALTSVPQSLTLPFMKSSYIYKTSAKYLSFKVKSQDEVFVDFGVNNQLMFRLTIGALNNKVSGIGPLSDPMKYYEKTENILDGNSLRGFWVRWISNGVLEFGLDGKKTAISFYNSGVDSINSVMFSSNVRDSFWQIADLPRL
ncbi:hypothetical protein ACFFRR_002237 [Megaselia abdita]